MATPSWRRFGLSLGYAYVRRLLGVGAGCVLVVALGLNPAFAWNARITLTEALALAQNFGGLLALLVAQERRSVVWGLVAGGVLGSGTFNRVDAGLIGLAPLAFSVVVMVCSPELRRVASAAGAGYLLLSTAGHLDVARAAPFYVHDLVQGAHLGVLMAGSTLWGALAVALPFVPARVIARARLTERTLRWLSFSVFVGLTLWLAWGLLVRPRISSHESATSMMTLTWYVTPVVWPLCLVGFAVASKQRELPTWLPLLAAFSAALVVFTAAAAIVPVHIYAARRWVPQVIPFCLVVALLGAQRLLSVLRGRAWRSVLALGLFAAYAVPAGNYTRVFAFESMLHQLPLRYARLVRELGRRNTTVPLITGHPHLASVLTYVYDVPTALLMRHVGRNAMAHGEFEGDTGVGFTPFELGTKPDYSDTARGTFLETTRTERPQKLVSIGLCMDAGRIAGERFTVDVSPVDKSLSCAKGRRVRGGLRTTGRAGPLTTGPHVTLAPGSYEVSWFGGVQASGHAKKGARIAVLADADAHVLAETRVALSESGSSSVELGALGFTLNEERDDVQFRLDVGRDVRLTVSKIRFKRLRTTK